MRVTAHQFCKGFKELLIWAKPYKNGSRCPVCERRSTHRQAVEAGEAGDEDGDGAP